jgi:Rieske Fe-S protein
VSQTGQDSGTPCCGGGSTRREFVGTIGAVVGARFALPVLTGEPEASAAGGDGTWVQTVKVDELPADSFRLYRQQKFVLARKGDVVRALSIVCTHKGCDATPGKDRATKALLVCGCHGGQFDMEGKVVKGPPQRPLPLLAVRVKDGMIEVDPKGKGEEAGVKVK